MVQCVEQRFGDVRAPQKVQWLSDNGSIFAAGRTLEIAVALNLEPCFTPVESPESNGMAEAFREDLQARLCSGKPASRRANRALTDRSLDGGLQLGTPTFPSGLPLTAGVHCITSTSRVSGLTGSTPVL